jgi:hypothetical protein
VAVADFKGNGGGGDGSGSQYPALLFFSNHCGRCFCLASVKLYSRNSNKGNILIFPLSQGIYHAGGGIYHKQREISIDMETVVTNRTVNSLKLNSIFLNFKWGFDPPWGIKGV